MKPKLLLRIAASLLVFHLVGHTIGHFTWKDTEDATLKTIIQQMDYSFDFMGTSQTLAGHHDGYSMMLGLTLAMLCVVIWIFSNQVSLLVQFRNILVSIGIFLIIMGAVEAYYFFAMPGITSALAGIAIMGAVMVRTSER